MSDNKNIELQQKIDELEGVLFEIASQAHGHRQSTLYVNGANVALGNIRNLAAATIGQSDHFKKLIQKDDK